jgi:dienelactone hydrolase
MRTLNIVAGVAILLTAVAADARIRTETREYKDGNTVLEGVLAYDDAQSGRRPGIVVVHDWSGLGPDVKGRVEMLAKLGYVAFAADIYGKGVVPKDAGESAKLAGKFKADRPMLRRRAQAALDVLLADPHVDPKRVAAMGYCFGGGTALDLARSGAPLRAVVSFHGFLDTPDPADAKAIRAKATPSPSSIHLERSAGVPWTNLGNQARGALIVRPSTRSTTRASALTSTWHALGSGPAWVEVRIPSLGSATSKRKSTPPA